MKRCVQIMMLAAVMFWQSLSFSYILGDVSLKVYHSDPKGKENFYGGGWKSYYLDYDVQLNGGFISEAFCVENRDASSKVEKYTLLRIDRSLSDYGLNADAYLTAAWIAENYYNKPKQEKWKAGAQVAIWEVIFDSLSINLSAGNMKADGYKTEAETILASLPATIPDFSSRWALAVNPTIGANGTVGISGYQNYLVQVPEPATMVLLGFGLLGIVFFSRRRIIR